MKIDLINTIQDTVEKAVQEQVSMSDILLVMMQETQALSMLAVENGALTQKEVSELMLSAHKMTNERLHKYMKKMDVGI